MKKLLLVISLFIIPTTVFAQNSDKKIMYQENDQRLIDLQKKHESSIRTGINNMLQNMDDKQVKAMKDTILYVKKEVPPLQKNDKLEEDNINYKQSAEEIVNLKALLLENFDSSVYQPIAEPETISDEQ